MMSSSGETGNGAQQSTSTTNTSIKERVVRLTLIAEVADLPSKVHTERVEVEGYEWSILCFKKNGFLCLFLECFPVREFKGWYVAARARLQLLHPTELRQSYCKSIVHRFDEQLQDWGFLEFLNWSTVESDGFIKDGKLRVQVTFQVEKPCPNRSLLKFDKPFKNSDMVLVVDQKKMHCHKAILSVHSPVFDAMLNSSFKESAQSDIHLPDKEYEPFLKFLRTLYHNPSCQLLKEDVVDVLPLANEYQVQHVVDSCEQLLTEKIQDETALEYLLLAQCYNLCFLKEAAISRLASITMSEIQESPLYDELRPELLNEVLEERVRLLEKDCRDRERDEPAGSND